jgi:MFS family permease
VAGVNDRTDPWQVLGGCFLLSVGVNAFVIAPSSVAPPFAERFGVATAAVGDVVSAAILGVILVQIPAGYLLDRFDNRRLVVPAVGLYVLVALGAQGVGSFDALLGLRVLGGVLVGFVFTAGANVVAEVFPPERRGLATGLYLASPPTSFAFAHASGPFVAESYGPLRVFLLPATVAVLGAALFALAAREPVRTGSTPTASEFARALGNRSVLVVGLSAFAAYALYLFLNTWLPTYGTTVLSLPLPVAGLVTAVVPLVGIVARPGGGWVSGRLGGRRRPVLAGGLLLGLVLLVAVPFADGTALFLLLVAGAAFAVQLGTGVYYVLTRELAAPGTEGTSLTVLTAVSFTGSFAAPVVGGWLVEGYSWTAAFLVFAGVGLLGALVLLLVPEPGEGERPEGIPGRGTDA